MTLSNAGFGNAIGSRCVAAWHSVAPVPRITVDFGGGRKLERTLGGNTVLTLQTPDGLVLDAWPGVYEPAALLAEMLPALDLAGQLPVEQGKAWETVRAWHEERGKQAVLSEVRRTTLSKMFVESPLLKALRPPDAGGGRPRFAPGKGQPPALRGRAAPQPAVAAAAGASPPPLAPSLLGGPLPALDGGALDRLATRLEDASKEARSSRSMQALVKLPASATPEQRGAAAVKLDSAVNVSLMRPAVHLMMGLHSSAPDRDALTREIFDRLLHIPLDDPYLGLADVLPAGTPG